MNTKTHEYTNLFFGDLILDAAKTAFNTFNDPQLSSPKRNKKPLNHTTMKKQSKPTPSPYELFKSKDGTWKWRKRAKNKKIINHSYNSKASAIKGMKADYAVTIAMESFTFADKTVVKKKKV